MIRQLNFPTGVPNSWEGRALVSTLYLRSLPGKDKRSSHGTKSIWDHRQVRQRPTASLRYKQNSVEENPTYTKINQVGIREALHSLLAIQRVHHTFIFIFFNVATHDSLVKFDFYILTFFLFANWMFKPYLINFKAIIQLSDLYWSSLKLFLSVTVLTFCKWHLNGTKEVVKKCD